MSTVKITIGKVVIGVELLDTPTARAIAANLPLGSKAKTWGDEVYFDTPVMAELEDNAKDIMQPGEISFWPEGQCIVLGFGPTPMSEGDEIKLAAKTNVWGRALNDVKDLKAVKSDDFVFIEQV
jgi:uncharacterized protein